MRQKVDCLTRWRQRCQSGLRIVGRNGITPYGTFNSRYPGTELSTDLLEGLHVDYLVPGGTTPYRAL